MTNGSSRALEMKRFTRQADDEGWRTLNVGAHRFMFRKITRNRITGKYHLRHWVTRVYFTQHIWTLGFVQAQLLVGVNR